VRRIGPMEGLGKTKSQKSEVRSQESGVRSQESGVRSQESGVRSQESGVRNSMHLVPTLYVGMHILRLNDRTN